MLLDLFSEMDDVFTEPDAFANSKVSLGRLYRSWKRFRLVLDPDFERHRHRYKRSLYD